jgi:hypothetical protein
MHMPHSFLWAMFRLRRGGYARRRAWVAGCYIRAPDNGFRFLVLISRRYGPKLWTPYWADFWALDWTDFLAPDWTG